MTCFITFAYIEYKSNNKIWALIWGALAVLINPFVKIALTKPIWSIVDIIIATILIISIFIKRKTSNKIPIEEKFG
ncbi:MAG: hypothetical protein LBR45_03430 [Bacteroidales bacterium]|jgi:uncharacterized protein (DUF983 family)|nr:hypothetical protein [Bacteroidales bacterium]